MTETLIKLKPDTIKILNKNSKKIIFICISVSSFFLIKKFDILNYKKKYKTSKKRFLKWWCLEKLIDNSISYIEEVKYYLNVK